MRNISLLVFAAVLMHSAALLAQAPTPGRPTATPATPAAPATQAATQPAPALKIDAFAWFKGYWTGDGFGGTVETLMGPPRAAAMLGSFRHIKKDGKPGFYEICAVEEHEGSLRFVIKHFHPNWIGWEEKDHALQARLTRASKDEWTFGNMVLRRTGKDTAVMELTIYDRASTAPRKEVLNLKRTPL